MVQKIVWSKEARQNLLEIKNYIANDSLFYAEKLVKGITGKVKVLRNYPEIDKIVLHTDKATFRRLLYKSYCIVYVLQRSSVYIVTVYHQSRQLPEDLEDINL